MIAPRAMGKLRAAFFSGACVAFMQLNVVQGALADPAHALLGNEQQRESADVYRPSIQDGIDATKPRRAHKAKGHRRAKNGRAGKAHPGE